MKCQFALHGSDTPAPQEDSNAVRKDVRVDSTPIDYLDFASPVSGLGRKMGVDATHKWPGETNREWGRTLQMTPEVTAKVDQMRQMLGF